MPTYDYACEACDHKFEEFQSITAKPLRKCPACGKARLARLMGTGGGIIFKGSGFYQTDYRSESYKKAAEADKTPAAPADAKPATPAASTDAPATPKPAAAPKPAAESKKAKASGK